MPFFRTETLNFRIETVIFCTETVRFPNTKTETVRSINQRSSAERVPSRTRPRLDPRRRQGRSRSQQGFAASGGPFLRGPISGGPILPLQGLPRRKANQSDAARSGGEEGSFVRFSTFKTGNERKH